LMAIKTPLEDWIAVKVGVKPGNLTPEILKQYQLKKIRQTLRWVKEKSLFYRKKLEGVEPEHITDFEHFAKLPFTFPCDLQENPLAFVCSKLTEISRIVTLQSSGTTGQPKRVFFTSGDQELTIDFFDYGMRNLVGPQDRVMILLPCQQPGSVGDLLQKGLERLGAFPIPYGLVTDTKDAIEQAILHRATAMVGVPIQILAMARHQDGAKLQGKIRSVLLSTDYVPAAICHAIKAAWQAEIFNHYGMTEMGLGGGVQCQALAGYHLREADLYFEIVDPETGRVLPPGETGEIVFTTLTRTGMPLIRYRTGDLSRFLEKPCACGTVLRSLDLVKYRISERIKVGDEFLAMPDLDEKIFSFPGVLNYHAVCREVNKKKEIYLEILMAEGYSLPEVAVKKNLFTIPAIKNSYPQYLHINVKQTQAAAKFYQGGAKRKILQK